MIGPDTIAEAIVAAIYRKTFPFPIRK